MTRTLPSIAAFVMFSSLAAAWADEAKPEKIAEPVTVKSLDQAKLLAPHTTSVSVSYTSQMKEADQFTAIMMTLSRNPRIRRLTLRIPNSSHAKDETLDVLRKFQSLETLEIVDAREWEAPLLFEHVSAVKNLKRLKLSFL